MNQDNFLAEALKMRNLISEFNAPVYNDRALAASQAVAHARRAASTSPETPPAAAGVSGERACRPSKCPPTRPPVLHSAARACRGP
jgi:hypothetical protein